MTDWRAAAANLPPVDSHSLAPVLLGTGESTRKEIPIGTEPRMMRLYQQDDQVSTIQGVIREDETGRLWKLLIGHVEMAGWTGPRYPNATTDTCCFSSVGGAVSPSCPTAECFTDCNDGCLYEVSSAASQCPSAPPSDLPYPQVRGDPNEHTELSAEYPEIKAALTKRIEELKESAFVPVRCTGCDDGFGGIMCGTASGIGCQYPAACEMAMSSKAYGGFWGPFIDVPEPV